MANETNRGLGVPVGPGENPIGATTAEVGTVKYKSPPIYERVIGVYQDIPQEKFDALLPSWIEKIGKEYSVADPTAEWFIDIEQKNGIPILQNLQPKAKIIHVFWKRHAKNWKVFGMRLRPDRLVFHLLREQDKPHDFEELIPEMERWLRPWAEHFEIGSLKSITVEYVNILDKSTVPQVITADGAVPIASLLEMFGMIPGPYQQIIMPFDCKVRFLVDAEKPSVLDLRVLGLTPEEGSGVRVDFTVTTSNKRHSMTFDEGLAEIQSAHSVIVNEFDCFFTKKAKDLFCL